CGDASEAIDARRLDLERLLEQTAGVYHRCRRRWQVEHRLAAHDEVDELGAVRPFAQASPRFDVDDLQADRARDPADDLVLNVEDAASFGIEAFGPELACFLGLHQAGGDAHAVALGGDAAREQVTYLQLAADLRRVRAPALVGERGVAGDDGDSGQRARNIADEAVGDPVGEVVLLRIAAEIDEGKNGNRGDGRFEAIRRKGNVACHRNAVLRVWCGG